MAETLGELVARAAARAPLEGPGKSGARLERLSIDGAPYVLKHLDRRRDWTLRASGLLRTPTAVLWDLGVFARLPQCLDTALVAVEDDRLLMRDVGAWLVPATDEPIAPAVHEQFVGHMACLHAAFWGDAPEVVPSMHRYLELSPWTAEAEAEAADPPLVPRLIAAGWPLFGQVAPAAAAVVGPLARDPGPLVEALERTPHTLVHGNWKLDNLGVDPRGRTVLLDWELPGRGAPLTDLAWYLAINCRRLPVSKEATIAQYRTALEDCGVDTSAWWDAQLGLALLGGLVQFGWEKAFGGYDEELAWWCERALDGARHL
jgi:hypothetical protein